MSVQVSAHRSHPPHLRAWAIGSIMRKSAAKAEMNQSRSTSQKIDHMIDHSPAPPPQLLAAPVSVQGQRRARQHHQPPQMAVFDLVRGHQQSLWLRGPSAVAGEAMASSSCGRIVRAPLSARTAPAAVRVRAARVARGAARSATLPAYADHRAGGRRGEHRRELSPRRGAGDT